MNEAICFPETIPVRHSVLPLLLVFSRLVHCQPVENIQPQTNDPLLDKLLAEGLLVMHAPAPLGADRERFLRLSRDLRERRDGYAAQLSALSLAGLTSNPGLESKNAILASLRSREIKSSDTSQEELQLLLWQARLLLVLGEQFDQEQRELEQALTAVSAMQEELLEELRHEEEDAFSLTSDFAPPPARLDNMERLRLKAWARITFLGGHPLTGPLFITRSSNAFDLLAEQHAKHVPAGPSIRLRITLPERCEDASYLSQLNDFLQETPVAVRPTFPEQDSPSLWDTQKWDDALERHFPAAEHGRLNLAIHHFSGCPAADLLPATFGGYDPLPGCHGSSTGFFIGLLIRPEGAVP